MNININLVIFSVILLLPVGVLCNMNFESSKQNIQEPINTITDFNTMMEHIANIINSTNYKIPKPSVNETGNKLLKNKVIKDLARITRDYVDKLLQKAKVLADQIKNEIDAQKTLEKTWREDIVTARTGMTLVTVTAVGKAPMVYFIRNGEWSTCNGTIIYPPAVQTPHTLEPKCIGNELKTPISECAFHTVIKYDILPSQTTDLSEPDYYVCLGYTHDYETERYSGVLEHFMNKTCGNGTLMKMQEKINKCGEKTLLEFTHYSGLHAAPPTSLPTSKNEAEGQCRLTVGWLVTGGNLQLFTFFNPRDEFKKMFTALD